MAERLTIASHGGCLFHPSGIECDCEPPGVPDAEAVYEGTIDEARMALAAAYMRGRHDATAEVMERMENVRGEVYGETPESRFYRALWY